MWEQLCMTVPAATTTMISLIMNTHTNVVRFVTGEEPPGYLIVYRNGNEILRADVVDEAFSYQWIVPQS